MSTIKSINENSILYAKPDGYFYHTEGGCIRLSDSFCASQGYQQIQISDIEKLKLSACPICAVEKIGAKEQEKDCQN